MELCTVYLAFMALMSIALFLMMGIDKKRAQKGAFRVPEKSLFLMAILCGAVGGTIGMRVYHHKTKHWYFALFFPLLAVLQIALAVILALGII